MAHHPIPQTSDAAPGEQPSHTTLALNGVWLGSDACLIQSHMAAPPDEPLVIHVVGVADCRNHTGWVLMEA